MENITLVTFSNGRPARQGTCPVCKRRLARVVKGTLARPGI
jgi:hypothetical protein